MRRLLRRPFTLTAKSFFGARFNVRFPDMVQMYLYFFGIWEPVISRYVLKQLAVGDIFIDVGANVGYYTLLASRRVGRTGRVFAIEAAGSTYAQLQRNLASNGAANVTAYHVAVSDAPGEVPIWLSTEGDSPGTTTLAAVAQTRRHLVIAETVQAKPLQQIIDAQIIRNARLIKIVVEGAEWGVVASLAELLKMASPRTELIIEISDYLVRRSGGTAEALIQCLAEAGFEAFVIPNSYYVEFLINRPKRIELRRLERWTGDQQDVVFRRRTAAHQINVDQDAAGITTVITARS